jgi:hypothetical protein
MLSPSLRVCSEGENLYETVKLEEIAQEVIAKIAYLFEYSNARIKLSTSQVP